MRARTRGVASSRSSSGTPDGASDARRHGGERQPALPRRHDVRRLGRPRPGQRRRVIHRALDAGINFIDTADVYSRGGSEEIVGTALSGGKRDGVVLATKVHGSMGDDPNERGNSRRWITREVEASLRRLKTDWIDLYQLHRPDPVTDIDETLGALTDLVRQGKIRYFGHSDVPGARDRRGAMGRRAPRARAVPCEQPPHSLLARGIEADVLPVCARYRLGVISWSPLAGGWLSGRYRKSRRCRGACAPRASRAASTWISRRTR